MRIRLCRNSVLAIGGRHALRVVGLGHALSCGVGVNGCCGSRFDGNRRAGTDIPGQCHRLSLRHQVRGARAVAGEGRRCHQEHPQLHPRRRLQVGQQLPQRRPADLGRHRPVRERQGRPGSLHRLPAWAQLRQDHRQQVQAGTDRRCRAQPGRRLQHQEYRVRLCQEAGCRRCLPCLGPAQGLPDHVIQLLPGVESKRYHQRLGSLRSQLLLRGCLGRALPDRSGKLQVHRLPERRGSQGRGRFRRQDQDRGSDPAGAAARCRRLLGQAQFRRGRRRLRVLAEQVRQRPQERLQALLRTRRWRSRRCTSRPSRARGCRKGLPWRPFSF